MKNTAKHLFLIASTLGLFTVSCGDNFSDPKDAGPYCIYAGVRYTPGQGWKAKDGCNVCTCGFESQVLCSKNCGVDGGKLGFETGPAVDTGSDQTTTSDVLVGDDLGADHLRDAAAVDVPVSGDAKSIDAAPDSFVSDARLASERE